MGVVDGLDKGTAFVMMVVAAIALGTWLNAFQRNEKLAKLTIELQYMAFTPLVGIWCIVGCFALDGAELGSQMAAVEADNGRVYLLVGSGVTLALSSVLLLFSTKRLGMTVCLFTQASVSVVLGSVLNYFVEPDKSDEAFLFTGVALSVCAVCVCAYANSFERIHLATDGEDGEAGDPAKMQMQWVDGETSEPEPEPAAKKVSSIGLFQALGSAICGAAFSPMFSLAVKEEGQSGWSVGGEPLPVLVAVVFWSVGFGLGGSILSGLDVHFSSEPLNNFKNLWDAGHTAHLFIVGAAVILAAAEVCMFVAGAAAGFAAAFAISMANPLIGSLWGIFLWKEFVGMPARASCAMAVAALLYVVSVAMVILSA